MSKTSRRHSRKVSSTAGNDPNCAATASRSERALALLPERRAAPGAPARQQQCAAGDLAKLRRKERAAAQLLQHQRLDLVGRRHEQRRIGGGSSTSGNAHHEPVVAPHGLDVEAELEPEAGRDGQAPRE